MDEIESPTHLEPSCIAKCIKDYSTHGSHQWFTLYRNHKQSSGVESHTTYLLCGYGTPPWRSSGRRESWTACEECAARGDSHQHLPWSVGIPSPVEKSTGKCISDLLCFILKQQDTLDWLSLSTWFKVIQIQLSAGYIYLTWKLLFYIWVLVCIQNKNQVITPILIFF